MILPDSEMATVRGGMKTYGLQDTKWEEPGKKAGKVKAKV